MPEGPPCSQCGEPLPEDWKLVEKGDAEPICPACAVKHMKSRSQRRKVIATLLDMYGLEDEAEFLEKKKREGAAPPAPPG